MPIIEVTLTARAPIERVFDLSRSVEMHMASTRQSNELAVGGVTNGLLELNDEVTWQATHLWVRQRLTSRITAFDRPRYFRDSMVRGTFKRFDHDHYFTGVESGTLLRDRFDFESPLGLLGHLADVLFLNRYIRRFLSARLHVVKSVAESDSWEQFLRGCG